MIPLIAEKQIYQVLTGKTDLQSFEQWLYEDDVLETLDPGTTILLGFVCQQGRLIRPRCHRVFESLMHALLNCTFWQKPEAKVVTLTETFLGPWQLL